jgi:hypothetical protein
MTMSIGKSLFDLEKGFFVDFPLLIAIEPTKAACLYVIIHISRDQNFLFVLTVRKKWFLMTLISAANSITFNCFKFDVWLNLPRGVINYSYHTQSKTAQATKTLHTHHIHTGATAGGWVEESIREIWRKDHKANQYWINVHFHSETELSQQKKAFEHWSFHPPAVSELTESLFTHRQVDATNPGSKTFSVLSLAGVKVHVFAPLGELFDDACHATLGAIKLLIECFFGRDSYSFVFFFFTAKVFLSAPFMS